MDSKTKRNISKYWLIMTERNRKEGNMSSCTKFVNNGVNNPPEFYLKEVLKIQKQCRT